MANVKQLINNSIAVIFQWAVGYISSVFLTIPVLSSVAFGIIAYLAFIGDDMSFLQNYSWIIPITAEGNLTLDGSGIMGLFFKISFLVLLIKEAVLYVTRKFTGNDFRLSFKHSFLLGLLILTIAYIPAMIAIPCLSVNTDSTKTFLTIFETVMFIAAVASYSIYAIINYHSRHVSGFIKSTSLNERERSGA